MSERAIRKQQQKTLAYYTPSAYSKALNKYLRSTAKSVDPLLKSIARHCPFASIVPAYHSLRAASRLFILSELQALLAVHALETSQWDIHSPSMMQGTSEMGELFRFPVQNELDRRVGLLMMVACYWAKTALNDDCESLLEQATKNYPGLSITVQQWLLEHPSLRRITLREINRLFCSHQQSRLPNYNYLVDQIITLSHSYASENQSNTCKRSHEESDLEISPRHRRVPRKLIKFDLDFAPPQLTSIVSSKQQTVEGVEVKISTFSIFDQLKVGESQFKGLLQASDKFNLPFPSIFQSTDNDYIQVGIGEGESELVVFGEAFSTMFLARKGFSQVSEAKQLP